MARTLSGHPGIRSSADPRLVKRYVPGRPVWLRVRRAYAPLFLRLAVLLDQVEPLKVTDTWSYAYRPARLSNGLSDHSGGTAIDCWSSRIGANTTIANNKMPADKAKAISKVLKQFKTADGRCVFGWGVSKQVPGVDYPITYDRMNDPMHFFIAPGVSPADAAEVIKRLGIQSDGTVR